MVGHPFCTDVCIFLDTIGKSHQGISSPICWRIFFSASSIYLQALASDDATKQYARSLFIASLFLAVCAVFTMANGILIFLVLFVYAVLVKASNGRRALILCTFAASAWFYFSDYQRNPQHIDPAVLLTEYPLAIIEYLLTYLGGIFKHGLNLPDRLCQITGSLFLALLACYLIKHFFVKPLNIYQLALLGIAGFIVLTALATAIGRLHSGYEQTYDSRYATPVLIGWSSLALISFAFIASRIIVILLFISIINYQFAYPYFDNGNRILKRQLGLISLMVGSRDNNALTRLHPDPNFPAHLSVFLEKTTTLIISWVISNIRGKNWMNNSCRKTTAAALVFLKLCNFYPTLGMGQKYPAGAG